MRELVYVKGEEKEATKALYAEMFYEDSEEYRNMYYRFKGSSNKVLVLKEDGEMLSMVHQNPYTVSMLGWQTKVSYLVAVATRPQYRRKGCMRTLLEKTLRDLYKDKEAFTFLMPANPAYYEPFDFRYMGNAYEKELLELDENQLYEKFDLFVIKDGAYHAAHVESPWEKTPLMMRIVYLPMMISAVTFDEIAEGGNLWEASTQVVIRIEDKILKENDGTFLWKLGPFGSSIQKLQVVDMTGKAPTADAKFGLPIVPISALGEYLFGRRTAEDVFAGYDARTIDVLSKAKVIKRSYINEVV